MTEVGKCEYCGDVHHDADAEFECFAVENYDKKGLSRITGEPITDEDKALMERWHTFQLLKRSAKEVT